MLYYTFKGQLSSNRKEETITEEQFENVEATEKNNNNLSVEFDDSNKEKQSANSSMLQRDETLEEIMFPDFETESPVDELYEVEQIYPSIEALDNIDQDISVSTSIPSKRCKDYFTSVHAFGIF